MTSASRVPYRCQIGKFIGWSPAFRGGVSDDHRPGEVALEIALQYFRIDLFLIDPHSSVDNAVAYHNHSEFVGAGLQRRKIIGPHSIPIYGKPVVETGIRF